MGSRCVNTNKNINANNVLHVVNKMYMCVLHVHVHLSSSITKGNGYLISRSNVGCY
jgi:hypothetical protein